MTDIRDTLCMFSLYIDWGTRIPPKSFFVDMNIVLNIQLLLTSPVVLLSLLPWALHHPLLEAQLLTLSITRDHRHLDYTNFVFFPKPKLHTTKIRDWKNPKPFILWPSAYPVTSLSFCLPYFLVSLTISTMWAHKSRSKLKANHSIAYTLYWIANWILTQVFWLAYWLIWAHTPYVTTTINPDNCLKYNT